MLGIQQNLAVHQHRLLVIMLLWEEPDAGSHLLDTAGLSSLWSQQFRGISRQQHSQSPGNTALPTPFS